MMHLYPLTADARAIPCPVFPEVGSIRVSPGLILPSDSASSTIFQPIRSLIDPPGLKNSHFAYSLHSNSEPILFNFTVGVLPIVDKIFS